MSETGNIEQTHGSQTAVQHAAEDLANRLKALADTLAAEVKPRRLSYGPGRVGRYIRRQSPEGYVLDPVSAKVLMADGRLWTYSRGSSARFPQGRLFDARVDYPEFAGARSFPGGREFTFLGVKVGKYSFGWAAPDEGSGESDSGDSDSGCLQAIYGEGLSVHWLTADEAFADIAASVIANQPD